MIIAQSEFEESLQRRPFQAICESRPFKHPADGKNLDFEPDQLQLAASTCFLIRFEGSMSNSNSSGMFNCRLYNARNGDEKDCR